MPLLQSLVISKHLQTQNKEFISDIREYFKNHFHSLAIQENIQNSKKEKKYLGGLLIDVHLYRELKNAISYFKISS